MKELPAPWQETESQKGALEGQLLSEVGTGHVLYGLSVKAIARRVDQDDVLFLLKDGRVAEVHLTWGAATADPKFPRTQIFVDAEEWAITKSRTETDA